MTSPTIDIILPVWNSPTETRACLVSILDSTTTARLIIINNGCDRDTELMLELFCDHLGERVIYMTMERNIGFVPAINRALIRSDAEWALIIRPTGSLTRHCLQQILTTATKAQAGIITPHCPSEQLLPQQLVNTTCPCIESCVLNFSALALSRKMREVIGHFDEELDGGTWCLRDYRHRAHAHTFKTYLLPTTVFISTPATIFGSDARRSRVDELAITVFRQRWGEQHHFSVYLPKEADAQTTQSILELLVAGARHGHCFELFLHRPQYAAALQLNALCFHSGITLHRLSILTPYRSLARGMKRLMAHNSKIQPVCGLDGIPFPGYDTALPATTLVQLATP
jgi:hypothetical protein